MRKNEPVPIPGAVDPVAVAKAREHVLSADDAARLTSLLSLLADPVRVRILDALESVGELCVGDLALALDVNEDAASYGLRLLRTAGLVQSPQGRPHRGVPARPTASPNRCSSTACASCIHLSRLASAQ